MTSQPEPVPPSTPSSGLPAGLSPNGHPTPTRELLEKLPQMLAQAMAAVLQQVPVTVAQPLQVRPLPCAQCYLERMRWGKLHEAALAKAEADYQAALAEMAQRPEEDQVPVNGLDYLPARLHPGAPQGPPPVSEPVTMAGGTLVCAAHIPGSPGQPGSSGIIPVTGYVSPSMLANLTGRAG